MSVVYKSQIKVFCLSVEILCVCVGMYLLDVNMSGHVCIEAGVASIYVLCRDMIYEICICK